jgi:hypothetical protein
MLTVVPSSDGQLSLSRSGERGRPRGVRLPALVLLGAALACSAPMPRAARAAGRPNQAPRAGAPAQPASEKPEDGKGGQDKAELDSEDLFGFTIGSDVGDVGETELSLDTRLRASRRGGSYRVWQPGLEAEYIPLENFSFAGSVTFDHFRIRGVQGLDDRVGGGVGAIGAEFKYALLTRKQDGVGLTVSVQPQLGFFEDDSGQRGTRTALEARLSADAELVPDRLFGAINVSYEPEVFRPRYPVAPDGDPTRTERDATLGIGGALSVRLGETLFAGAELRYLRKYEGIALRSFDGEALYLGPTMFWQVGEKVSLSAAWNVQVAGHAKGQPGALDLDDFDRHQARVKLKVSF